MPEVRDSIMGSDSVAEVSIREQARACLKLCGDYTPGSAKIASNRWWMSNGSAAADTFATATKQGNDGASPVSRLVSRPDREGVQQCVADAAANQASDGAGPACQRRGSSPFEYRGDRSQGDSRAMVRALAGEGW